MADARGKFVVKYIFFTIRTANNHFLNNFNSDKTPQ